MRRSSATPLCEPPKKDRDASHVAKMSLRLLVDRLSSLTPAKSAGKGIRADLFLSSYLRRSKKVLTITIGRWSSHGLYRKESLATGYSTVAKSTPRVDKSGCIV